MKIAFYEITTTTLVGGVQTAVWELANELASRSIEVHIYGGKGEMRPSRLHPLIKVFTFRFLSREKIPDFGGRFQRIVERLTFSFFASKRLRKNKYDVIVLTKPFDFFLPYLVKNSSKTRYVFISGGTDFFPGDKRMSERISLWFSCSHFNAWQIMSHYKKYSEVIYNGVNTDKFFPMQPDMHLKESLGIEKNETVFIFAGRLVGWKGVRYIIEAMKTQVLRELPLKALIIGNGPEKKHLKKMASSSAINDRIIFLDFIAHDELPRYYSISDAAIYPSIGDEAFGISIAEAMACGKPVIASYIGGIPEVVGTDGTCGFLVSPTKADQISGKMALLSVNTEMREAMGKSARLRIEHDFTWKDSADRLLSEIQKT